MLVLKGLDNLSVTILKRYMHGKQMDIQTETNGGKAPTCQLPPLPTKTIVKLLRFHRALNFLAYEKNKK